MPSFRNSRLRRLSAWLTPWVTFGRDDLERIVFYELSTRLLFYIAQSVISDDRLRRSLSVENPRENISPSHSFSPSEERNRWMHSIRKCCE